jgi:pre-mRNA-splicing helicase BRR2
MNLFDLFL